MKDKILSEIEENISVNQKLIHTAIDSIEKAADLMISVIKSGNKILWCGNGGSAADAQHLATELMSGMGNYNSKPICPYCYKDIDKKKLVIIKIVD